VTQGYPLKYSLPKLSAKGISVGLRPTMASDIGFGDMVNYQANDNSLFFTPIGNQLAGKTF
jgi:hypothetical protein